MLFVYAVVEELRDCYGDFTGEWSETKQRADYSFYLNGYEYSFPDRRIHGKILECNYIDFGYGYSKFTLDHIFDAVKYAADHDLGHEVLSLLRAVHELGLDNQGGVKYAL